MNHPISQPYTAPAMCPACSGTGTRTAGVIRLKLKPCRTCQGARFITAAVAVIR
ncbi:hypothetical protein [Yinghuangia sp. YIM S09857]|uniref:hypothetical protein n=1 Tax=Yinghuangia sp. YIM S09857 TaxID=3436929 RepID=UPI003F529206